MKHLTKVALAAMAMSALLAMAGVGSAVASELYKNTSSANDTQGVGTELTATLKPASSLLLKDTGGRTNDTCAGSELKGKIEAAGGGSHPSGKVSSLTFSGCSHTTTVLAPGELEVKNLAGTTNGTLISKGARITVKSTVFGVSCVVNTGTGTTLGTLTGAGMGKSATFDVNGVATLENGCGDSTLTGTYLVTSPTGLIMEGNGSGSELYKNTSPANDTQGVGTELTATLKSGSSLLLKDTGGLANDTCTGSELKAKIESAGGASSHPSGQVSTLTFAGCSHTTTVLAPGQLEVKNLAGTTNGTLISKGARITVKSTVFGVSCIVNTGTGTTLGTLTGAATGEAATVDVNGVATLENGCGDSTLTGTYLVTGPTGLISESGELPLGSELYRATAEGNDTQSVGTELTATLKSGSSLLLKDTAGGVNDTCTGSEFKAKIEAAGGESSHPKGNLSTLTFGGCSHAMTVLANGALEIKNIAGTTNGTLISKEARITFKSTIFGVSCVLNTGTGTTLGTLTGAGAGESATFDVNGGVTLENSCGDSTLTGTYLMTGPTGLISEEGELPPGSELYRATAEGNDTQGSGTELTATLKSGSSLLLKDTLGGVNDTCTGSELEAKIEAPGGEGSNPSGNVSTLTFGGCSHTTTVLAPGELEIRSLAGTTNGTMMLEGTRITVKSTIFGVSCVVYTGAGMTFGTLTGAAPGESATFDVNGVVTLENGCGDSTLTGTYLVTSPTGLVVEAS